MLYIYIVHMSTEEMIIKHVPNIDRLDIFQTLLLTLVFPTLILTLK